MNKNFPFLLFSLYFLHFYSFSQSNSFTQNNPYLAMKSLNNWKEIPYIDDFGDAVRMDHYGLISECTIFHDPANGTYWSKNKGYIYFNVNKERMGVFFYTEDKISATKAVHWNFDPEIKYIMKVKRQDNSVFEFPMVYRNNEFIFYKESQLFTLLNKNSTGEKLKLAIIHKGKPIHTYIVQTRKQS